MNVLKPTILALACTSLVACSSSGTDTTAVTASTTPAVAASTAAFTSAFAKESTDTAEKALKSGTPLEAAGPTSVGLNYDFSKKKTTNVTGELIKIGANASGEIEFEVDGEKVAFTSADITSTGDYQKTLANGKVVYLWNQGSHQLSELTTGTDDQQYHKILGYYVQEDNAPDVRALAVIGTETPEDAIKEMKMTATYNGWASIDLYPSTIVDDSSRGGRIRSLGDLKLTADFAKSTVKGSLTNISVRDAGATDFVLDKDRSATFQEAKISGNGYSGKITDGEQTSGDYHGKFYGNKAQETSGVISGNLTEDGAETHRVIGAFSAKKTTDN